MLRCHLRGFCDWRLGKSCKSGKYLTYRKYLMETPVFTRNTFVGSIGIKYDAGWLLSHVGQILHLAYAVQRTDMYEDVTSGGCTANILASIMLQEMTKHCWFYSWLIDRLPPLAVGVFLLQKNVAKSRLLVNSPFDVGIRKPTEANQVIRESG